MKQSSRAAVQAELNMKDQEEREEAAERAALEASYTEFESQGFVDSWDDLREKEAAIRLEAIQGNDEDGEPFESLLEYLTRVRLYRPFSTEEEAIHEKVCTRYRDDQLTLTYATDGEELLYT